MGWDSRESLGYDVAEFSLRKRLRADERVDVVPLILTDLRARGLYWRSEDLEGTTEFTVSRFLVPKLMNFDGWALFCDSDVLFLRSVCDLFSGFADNEHNRKFALMCVKHVEPAPTERVGMKKTGVTQSWYPRKNWSSVVLWNCGHPSNAVMTAKFVNGQSPRFLHRFSWLGDDEIGSLPAAWNHLVGYEGTGSYSSSLSLLHYTNGAPYMPGWRHGPMSDVWKSELVEMYGKDLRRSDETN